MTLLLYIKKLPIFFLLLVSLGFTQTSPIKNNNQSNDDALANKFFNERKYQLALIEYERLLLNNTSKPLIMKYRTKVAQSYERNGQRLEAINEYKKLLQIEEKNFSSILKVALLYQDIYYFYESNQFILNKLNSFDNHQLDTLKYLLSINYYALSEEEKSLKILDEINTLSESSLVKKNILNLKRSLPISPFKASLMNLFIPGSGYAYLKMPQTAIATFLTLSLFGYTTHKSLEQSNVFGSTFGGILFSGFYIGSIYGASQNARKKTNLKLESELFKMRNYLIK